MTVDTNGVTLDQQQGRLVGAMAIGDGPSAVLDVPGDGSVHGQISLNAMTTLLDVEELQARAEIEKRRGQR